MIKVGDLVTYINPSHLLPGLERYVGKLGIVIEKMDPDSDDIFYMVHWGDTICWVMRDNLKLTQSAQHIHTGEKNECRKQIWIPITTRITCPGTTDPWT